MGPKTLLVFCDGTGMDGTLAPPKSNKAVKDNPQVVTTMSMEAGLALKLPEFDESAKDNFNPEVASELAAAQQLGDIAGGNIQYATNVLRLARSVKSLDANGNRQIVFYQSGVGSESNFTGDPVTGTTAMQALGTAVASKIRDAYAFIAQNFEEGDEICLFGFSRGAYTARKLSGLIDRIGLLTRHELGYFFEIWRQLIDQETPSIPPDTRHPNIKCVGVWDTVGSVYKEIDALNIVDTALPKTVKVALHAISLQENRKQFLPTLWSIPQGGLQPGQILKQVWFAGAHSDVGGGYERHELADISVYWMAGEIKSLINMDLDFLRTYAQVRPDPWGTSQPHNAYKETPIALRPIVGHQTRLESSQIIQQSVFHDSVKYSPQQLTSPDYMITMSIIEQSFGSGFIPQYPPLNEFEQYCKNHWGTGSARPLPHGIESPSVVVRSTVRWIPRQTGLIPPDTVVGGTYGNNTVYVARAPYRGGLYPGLEMNNTMWITYDGKSISIPNLGYELLVGHQTRWISVSGNFSLSKLGGAVPVRGGRDTDGETLFVAQYVAPNGASFSGRVKENDLARFVNGDSEATVQSYNVLVFV